MIFQISQVYSKRVASTSWPGSSMTYSGSQVLYCPPWTISREPSDPCRNPLRISAVGTIGTWRS